MEYSVAAYGWMLADSVRMDAYAAALEATVEPGSVVVDIGAGTGIATLLAARLGAARVYAIEPSPVVKLLRDAARANGLDDRIEVIQALSTDVTLPERADVIVCDLRGLLPFHTGNLAAVADARRRLLRVGGTLIPQRDRVMAALVESAADYEAVELWRTHARGFDLSSARDLVVNSHWKASAVTPIGFLADPAALGEIDYGSVESADFLGRSFATVRRAGRAHGLCVWFDATLVDGIGFTNAPGRPELVYGRTFFPLSEPVDVAVGEEVSTEFVASCHAGHYVYGWNVSIGSEGAPRARFRQSTFAASPLTTSALWAGAEASVPAVTAEGALVRRVLELMDGSTSIGGIAAQIEAEAGSLERALELVSELAGKYGGH